MSQCGAGWVAYSIVNRDVFVFLANAGGLMIGLYFTLVAYGLTADANVRCERTVYIPGARHISVVPADIV